MIVCLDLCLISNEEYPMFHFHRNGKARHSERHLAPRFNTVSHRNAHWNESWGHFFELSLSSSNCIQRIEQARGRSLFSKYSYCELVDAKQGILWIFETLNPTKSLCSSAQTRAKLDDAKKIQQLGLRKRSRGSWRISLHRRVKPQLVNARSRDFRPPLASVLSDPENPFALQERDEHTSLVLASSSLHGPVLWLLH